MVKNAEKMKKNLVAGLFNVYPPEERVRSKQTKKYQAKDNFGTWNGGERHRGMAKIPMV